MQNKSKMAVSLTGGMGNQLFQIAAAIYHSTDKSIDVIGWLGRPRKVSSNTPSAMQFDFHGHVRLLPDKKVNKFWEKCAGFIVRRSVFTKQIEEFLKIGNFLEAVVKLLLKVKIGFKYQIVRSTGTGYADLALAESSKVLFGYFQSNHWLSNPEVLSIFQNMSVPNSSEVINYFETKSLKENPLIVHFRIGDYKFESEIGLLPISYYHRAFEAISASEKFNKIWLFSDEPQVAYTQIPDHLKSRTEIINVPDQNDALTMQIMRFGKGYILSNSTFGWWSARLAHFENPVVIVPDKWFKALPEPQKLVPENWVRIHAWE